MTVPEIPEDLREMLRRIAASAANTIGCESEHRRMAVFHTSVTPHRVLSLLGQLDSQAQQIAQLREALQDAERSLFVASNEIELRHMMPDAWVARWTGKVAAFRKAEAARDALLQNRAPEVSAISERDEG